MRKIFSVFTVLAFSISMLFLSGCSQVQLASHAIKKAGPSSKSVGTFKVGSPYKIKGRYYYPQESYDLVETGIASWYGPNFHGKSTANGEIFDMYELTAAHRTLQMPALVRVTNLENGRSLVVRINDRGPFARGRIIDLSKRSAELLGFRTKGTAKVRVEVLKNESMQIAQAAKRGVDTNGFEVALNNKQPLPIQNYQRSALDSAPAATTVQPSTQAVTTNNNYQLANVPSASLSNGQPAVINTRVDMNRVEPLPANYQSARKVEPVAVEQLDTYIPGHTKDGNFYPDPVIAEAAVVPTDIFVQAGSFSSIENATKLSQKLATYGKSFVKPATIDGKQFYRVRIGPIEDVNKADAVLDLLSESGNNSAIIIVE